jgi:hypothetical protein
VGERQGIVDARDGAIMIVVEFRKDLFRRIVAELGVDGWNRHVADLLERELIPPAWLEGTRPPPLAAMIDLRGLRATHCRLDGIDLRPCWLADADFTGSFLRDARLCCGRNVSYKGCRLDGADFRGVEISGADFTDATGLETALFDKAVYAPANPPTGLTPGILATCRPEAEPPPASPRQPSNPQEPSGYGEAPLRCFASIHVVPME